MTTSESPGRRKTAGSNSSHAGWVLLLNVALLLCAVALYGRYAAVYQTRLREENLGNIANLNQSAATNATALINSWGSKLDDVALYVSRYEMNRDKLLETIENSNASENRYFELIGADYTGYLVRRDEKGVFPAVSYQKSTYADLQAAIDDTGGDANGSVGFAPEFTDGYTALKHFAVYVHLPLRGEAGGTEMHTLLLSSPSRDVLKVFNNQSVFEGLSTVLVDAKGSYIVSSNDFKSDNFFQYLYVYNDLSLDQRETIRAEMLSHGNGELYYRDAKGRDCVFRYMKMTTNDWYCVTSVPLSSFHTPASSNGYLISATVALLLMMGITLLWLRGMNTRLRVSMRREKEASDAKTDFLSRMSHDIRTPLNGIIGMTALAADEPNPPRTVEYLDNIKASGNFLLGLVNDILDMSRVESGKVELHPEPYTRQEFCKYIQAVITPLCREKGLDFRMSSTEDNLVVMIDHLRMNQIFFNLLSNAVKYTPAGGWVEFSWKTAVLADHRASFDFYVRDNGIGMSAEFQRHMYETFTQEHAQTAGVGSGLGLSIVWNLLKLMGGQIDVSSKEGEGTSFHVHLEAELCREKAPEPAREERLELHGTRALICEDNAINAVIARRLLEKWGMSADVAENGRVGLERFNASVPGTYDAILMDIRMPEMNGLDATRAIRGLNRPDAAVIPIIAMTANAYDSDVQNCLDAGMNSHLSKPIEPMQLKEALVGNIARARAGTSLSHR